MNRRRAAGRVREQAIARRELLERFFDINYAHRAVFLALTLDPSGLAEVDLDNWIPRLAGTFQQLLLGPEPINDQRVRVVMIANGLSRVATFFSDIPHEELRVAAVNAALQTLDASPPAPLTGRRWTCWWSGCGGGWCGSSSTGRPVGAAAGFRATRLAARR